MGQSGLSRYLNELDHCLRRAEATDSQGLPISVSAAVTEAAMIAQATHQRGNSVFFIGNGGSAAICSHMAIDFSKNAGVRAMSFNDGAAITCLANDYSFAEVFSRQINFHARPGDLLVAISSSGRSADIIRGVSAARALGVGVVTLSGFGPLNPLRRSGDINFYVPSEAYGFVELSHHILCHAMVDVVCSVTTAFMPEPADERLAY